MTYIVTTTVEKKFLKNQDYIYAGSWCLKGGLENNNIPTINTLPYHWDARDALRRDRIYLASIKEQVLLKLTKCLNGVHNTSNTTEYWRLVIGYWVNIYCTVLFDRWQILKSCVENNVSTRMLALKVDEAEISTSDIEEFIKFSTESCEWNYYLFLKLADEFQSIKKEHIDDKLLIRKNTRDDKSTKNILQKLIIDKIYSITSIFKKNKIFTIKTYMPLKYEILLKLSIGEFLDLNVASLFNSKSYVIDNNLRHLIKLGENLSEDKFLAVTLKLVKEFLPTIYLEGYWQTLRDLEGSKLPKSPKSIYTANLHFGNDKFKLWMAEKKKTGSSIIIGEHGGLRIAKFNESHEYEKKIADHYLITGEISSENAKFIPVSNFRMQGKVCSSKIDGNITIVTTTVPQYAYDIRASIIGPQFINYFQEVIRLIDGIHNSKLVIRTNISDYDWHQVDRLKERFPNITIDDGHKDLIKLLNNSSIVVCTYNGTVFIDTISVNYPTIITWNPAYWEISDEAKIIFVELELVGVFHSSPQSAAQFINSISNDINKWWYSDDVQSALDRFRTAYGSAPRQGFAKIKHALISIQS